MSDFAEMLKSQTDAINRAYWRGLQMGFEQGHLQGYRAGKADGIEEARKLFERTFPAFNVPVRA